MHQTTKLYEIDAYRIKCDAIVVHINQQNGIILDQTVFYPQGGGQPGDQGLIRANGSEIKVTTTVNDRETGELVHVPNSTELIPKVGDKVEAEIDWSIRYLHMRMHTALHLLCSVVPCGVTGGQIGSSKSRLDFDVGEHTLDKHQITDSLNQLVQQRIQVTSDWVNDEILDQSPELVRTMSVKPPRGVGKVRLLKVGQNVDLQPCGGTHVKSTDEIGELRVSKIENKGKRNRRVNIVFAD